MHSHSSGKEEDLDSVVIDSKSNSSSSVNEASNKSCTTSKSKKKKKTIMCRDVCSFMDGHKLPGTEINGIVFVSNIRKKKKKILS